VSELLFLDKIAWSVLAANGSLLSMSMTGDWDTLGSGTGIFGGFAPSVFFAMGFADL
jgi:hypothetical protein